MRRAKTESLTPTANGDAGGPHAGDLLVTKRRAHGYTVSVFPGEPQLRHKKSDTLLAVARRFAEHQGVDCWLATNGTYARLCGHRPTDAVAGKTTHERASGRATRPVAPRMSAPARDRSSHGVSAAVVV